MINICTFKDKIQTRLIGWCCSLILVLGSINQSFAQIPQCAPATGNTLTQTSFGLVVGNLNSGCAIASVPDLRGRWTAVPGPGYMLVSVLQAPAPGTMITVPKGSTCPNATVPINIVAVFFYIGDPFSAPDDLLCSRLGVDAFNIQDISPPTIVTPKSLTLDVNAGCTVTAAQILAAYGPADVDDNCTDDASLLANLNIVGGFPIMLTCPTSPSAPFPVMVRTMDQCGNLSNIATINVTLRDLTAPMATCIGNQTRYFDMDCQYTVEDFRGSVTVSDICGAQVPPAGVSQRVIAPVVFDVDEFPIIITGAGCPSLRTMTVRICTQDCFGNGNLDPNPIGPIPPNCCTFIISVSDTTRPVPQPANCPGPVFLLTDNNCEVVIPDLRDPSLFLDNCDPILDATDIIQNPPPGPYDVSGLICTPDNTIDITFTYTDCNGNGPVSFTCDDVILVFDVTPPSTLTCPDPRPVFNLAINPLTCQYTTVSVPANFFNGVAIAGDNCDPDPQEGNDPGGPYDCTQLGIYSFDIYATDCSGNFNAFLGACEVLVQANPLDADWTNPGRVCMNDLPLNLCPYRTGVLCGYWSGDHVTFGDCASGGGIFNPPGPGAYAVTYTVGDADCHVEITRVINVEQAVAPPFLINDFGVCYCPDALLDLESLLLGSAPQGGTWTISNSGNLQFNLLPPPGPGNSHLARYDEGCGVATITYSYTDCTGTPQSDQILITIRRCADVALSFTTNYCQGESVVGSTIRKYGCDDYNVSFTGGNFLSSPLNTTLGAFGPQVPNPNAAAGLYFINLIISDPLGICPDKYYNWTSHVYQKAATPNGINPVGPVCETNAFPLNLSLINPNDRAGNPLTADNVKWFGGGVTDNGTTGTFTPNDSDGDGFPGPGAYVVCVHAGDPRCLETYCTTIIINNHVPGSCTLDEYRACLEPGATITFSDLLQSAAISGGRFIISSVVNNGGFSTNVAAGDTVTGMVYNGGCGIVNYQYVIVSCPTNIVCNGTVVINQRAHIDMTGPQTFCANDNNLYLLRNNGTTSLCGANGVFAGPGVVNSGNGATATFNASVAGEGTHLVTYTIGTNSPGGPNCQQVDSMMMTVYAASDPTFNLPLNTCADITSIPLNLLNPDPSVNAGSPDGVAEVFWSGNGVTDNGGNDPSGSFNPSVAGPGYHLVCVMTGEGPCMKYFCRMIRVFPVNNATLVADLNRGCYIFNVSNGGPFIDFNLEELLTANTTLGGSWSYISGPGGVIRNYTLAAPPGCHQLRYTVPAAFPGATGGCAQMTDDVFLLLQEAPQTNFDMAEEVCWNGIPGSLSLLMDYTGQTSGANATRTYSWTATTVSGAGPIPTFNNSAIQEPLMTVQGPGVFEICLTETLTYAACGTGGSGPCPETYCERITVHQTNTEVIPAWNRPNPFRFCTTDPCIDLDVLVTGTPNGVFTGQGVQLDPTHPNYRFCPAVAGPGTHAISYTVQNGAGCTAVMTRNVEVYAPPVNNCPNDSLVISCGTKRLGSNTSFGPFTSQGITFYITSNYSMSTVDLSSLLCPAATDGGTWTLLSSPANSQGAGATGVVLGDLLVYTDPGCYTVDYTVSSFPGAPAGCVVSKTYRILIGERPMPMMDLPDNICWAAGVPTITLNIPALYNTTAPAHSGTIVTTEYSSTNTNVATVASNGIVTIVGAGNTKICMRLTYMNLACTPSLKTTCQVEVCESLNVTQTNVATSPSWTAFGPICIDAACVDLDALVTGTPGGVFTGQGVVLGAGGHPNYDFCPPVAGAGTHAVTYTVNSPDGCTNVLTRNIIVAPLANATLANRQVPCLVEPGGVIPLSVLFASNATTGGGTWAFAGTPPAGAQIVGGNLIYTQAGCYCFTYTVTTVPGATAGGCFAQGTACLQISEHPTPSFSVQNEICWSTNDPVTTFTPLVNSPSYDAAGVVTRSWSTIPTPFPQITLNTSTGAFTINGPVPLGGLIFDLCMTENITTAVCGPTSGPNQATPPNAQVVCTETYCERISIRDGTLLNATFTATPVNPCLGQTVTLTPAVGGGTFTGNGVTNAGNGGNGTFVANVCGIYAVTYTIDDPNGCSNSYTLNIYTDTVRPSLTLPSNITVNCQNPLTPSMATWAAGASATDNCAGVSVTNRIFDRQSSCSPGTGTYVFMFTATDACGNTRIGFANYTVQDVTPPVISGGSNLVVECGNDVYARVYAWLNNHAGTTATDACDASNFLNWTHNFNGLINNYCGAPVPVTFFVSDRCGNSSSVTFTLQVRDQTPPVWNVRPQNAIFECDATSDPYAQIAAWLGSNGNGVALDSCQTTITYSNNFTGLSGGCNRNTGSALVTFTAMDVCGNATSAQATVNVVDRTPPEIISAAKDTMVECDGLGNLAALAAWINNRGGARAVDLCSGVSCQPLPGARAAFVAAPVTYPWSGGPNYNDYTTSMDQIFGAGNWDRFDYNTSPATLFSRNYRFIYIDGSDGVSSGDNNALLFNTFVNANRKLIESWVTCGGRLLLNAAPNQGGNIALGFGGVQVLYDGSTTFTNSVTQANSHPIFNGPFLPTGANYTGTSFGHAIVGPPNLNIIIRENGGANRTVLAESLWGGGIVMFGGMTASGWHSPQPNARNLKWNILSYLNTRTLQTDINVLNGGIFAWDTTLMRTEVTCGANRRFTYMFNALDSCGNISNATIARFIIRDTTPPVWSVNPSSLSVQCDGRGNVTQLNNWLAANGNGAILNDPCNGTVRIEHDQVREYPKCSHTDSTTYRFTAYDCSGNSSTREANFIIIDTRPPTLISAARDTTISCENLSGNNDDELIGWLNIRAGFVAFDTCSDVVNYSHNYHASNWVRVCGPSRFVNVTFSGRDDCGNVITSTARFSIVDTTRPRFLNCPPPIVQNLESGHCDAYVTVPKLIAIDNCTHQDSIIITQIFGPNPVQYRFPAGTTVLKYEARDLCNNRDTCTIKVVVNDYWDIPQITCRANVDTTTSAGVCLRNNLGGLAPTLVRDVCPHTAVTYVIRNEAGDTIRKGINDASGSNFPKGNNQVCYTVQDQPILLITEVTQQLGAGVGPTSPVPAFISAADVNGDYIEITNFGPSSIDVSCLSMKIFQGGAQVGVYTLPNMPGPVLPAGGILTLHVGPAIAGFPDNPGAFFFNMNLPEAAINMPRGYVLSHLDLRNLDVVTTNGYNITAPAQGVPVVTAADWSGTSATNVDRGSHYRRCIYDHNLASDWLLAESCEPASIGRINPILAPFVFPSNGLRTSVQTIAPQRATCCFNVNVRDTETPMCATNDTFVLAGTTGIVSNPGCYTFTLTVPATPVTKIVDVWVTNLNMNITNFANSEVTLIHPDGTRVRLWNDGICSGSTGFLSARISDLDATFVRNAICAGLGSGLNYRPEQALSALCPKSAAGTWRLEIENNSPAPSTLTLNSWQLTLISQRAYAQRDTIINNDLNRCGANFTWTHPTVMDNCCMGTVDVQYIPVPMPGCPLHTVPTSGRVNPGSRTTQFFGVGMTRVVYTLTDMSGNTGSCEFKITVRDVQAPVFMNCPKDYSINLPGGVCFAFLEIHPALMALDNCDSVAITVNPRLNTQLGIGTHKIVATGTDKAGNSTMCMWNITVLENNPNGRDIVCADLINFSLGPDCRGTLSADELLAGNNYGCKDKFTLLIEDWITGQVHSNLFTTADIGKYFKVTVTDPTTGNKCWSKVFIEYKATPAISCPRDTIIHCNSSIEPSALGSPVITSCVLDYDVHYDDTIQKARDCDFPIAFIIRRTFTVTNELGNGSRCTQIIRVRGFDLNAIQWPRSYDNLDLPALNCDEKRYDKDVSAHILPFPYCVDGYLLDSVRWYATGGNPSIQDPFTRDLSGNRRPKTLGWNCIDGGLNDGHPSPDPIYHDQHPNWRTTGACWGPNQVVKWLGTGTPALDGIPLSKDNKNCNLSIRYDDEVYDICANGYEILRYWKVRNMCLPPLAGVNPVEYIQVIKVLDQEGPKIAYPDTVVVGTNSLNCYGNWDVPFPWITDNCADSVSYTVRTWTGTAVQQLDGSWIIINMKLGIYPVVITAVDQCGNKTEKIIRVNVVDNTPPSAVCDKNIVVGITGNQSAGQNFGKIYAEDIDEGSFDNCRPHVFFKTIRMEQLRGTNNGSNVAQPDNGTNCAGINGDDNAILDGNQIYFDDYINFCCSDAGNRIMVVLRVFDVDPGAGPIAPSRMNQNGNLFGRYTDCMVEIEVQDKGVPTVIAPPNIVVSCWFWFDVDKLTDPNDPTFGRVVTDLSNRKKVVTNDLVCHKYCVRNDITGYPGFVPGAPPSNPPAWNRACDYYRTLFDTAHAERKYELTWGFDGYVLSNCGNNPTISVNDNRECGQGQLTRTVVARGPNGISVTATQVIWVVDCDPFYINRADNCDANDDITWPGNCTGQATTIQGCGADISPDNPRLGRPVIENGADDLCALISIEYVDEVFTIEPDACFKILRTWIVIDWCQYDPSLSPTNGRWEYLQIIKVHDNDKPQISVEIGNCEPAVKNATNICQGHINLIATATDNCSPLDWLFYDYKIDLFNDGIGAHSGYDLKVGPLTRKDFAAGKTPIFNHNPYADNANNPFEANGTYPVGTHKICWFVEDGCGNIGTTCRLFEIKDCKAPTPYCLTGIITVPMPTSGCVTIWAKDLDKGSFDNCTDANDLLFYFNGDKTATSMTICCDDFVAAGVNDELVIDVQMWVEDKEGNTDYCKTVVIVQDNQNICPDNVTAGKITGLLATEKGEETEFSDVQMYRNQQMMKQVTTRADGKFLFGDLGYGANMEYVVRPTRNDNPLNGVTTADIVKIQRHILGLETLNSPYKLIAADVNTSSTITAADIADIRKLVLGITSNFSKAGVESWTFVPKAYVFPNIIAPWNAPREAVISMHSALKHNEDFVAIKMGDVTNNAIAHNATNTTARHKDNLHFEIAEGSINAGEVYEVKFMSSNFNDIAAYQFTLKFDQEAMLFEGVEAGVLNVSETNFGMNLLNEGILTTSWNTDKGVSHKENEVLFTLKFRAMKNASIVELLAINSNITMAEAYNSSLDEKGIDLAVRTNKGVVETGVFELYQNAPNPFDNETVISFRLPTASPALLTIYDVAGKVIRVYDIKGVKGMNHITINKGDIETSGLLYYQLDSDNHTATKRMTKMK